MPARRYLQVGANWPVYIFLALLAVGSLYEVRAMDQVASRVIQWWGARPGIDGGDMYPPWAATRAALQGIDPYSPAVTAQIESKIYGHPIPDRSPWAKQAFVYPAHLILLLAPLTLLPWRSVVAILVVASFPVVAWTTLMWIEICCGKLEGKTKYLIVAVTLISWPSISILGRQPTVFVSLLIATSILLFRRSAYVGAGILLAMATVKPQLVALVICWLMTIAVRERRFRFISAFALMLGAMLLGASILVPHWFPQWLSAGIRYTRGARQPIVTALTGHMAGLILSAVLLCALAVRTWKSGLDTSDRSGFGYSAALLLSANACLISGSPWMIYNDLLLIPGVLILLAAEQPQRTPGVLLFLARVAVTLALLAPAICGWLTVFEGFSRSLALSPALLWYMLPVPVTAALLAIGPQTRGHSGLLQKAQELWPRAIQSQQ